MLPNSSTGQTPVEQSFSQHKTRQSTDIPAEKDCVGVWLRSLHGVIHFCFVVVRRAVKANNTSLSS